MFNIFWGIMLFYIPFSACFCWGYLSKECESENFFVKVFSYLISIITGWAVLPTILGEYLAKKEKKNYEQD